MISIQRRYEVKYFNRIKKVLKAEVSHIAGIVENRGIHAAVTYVNNHIHSKQIATIVKELYNEVGLRFARKTWIELQHQWRARKSMKSSATIETKGFGFNSQWVQFIKEFLTRFLLEKITFEVARTTKEILLTVLNNAIAGGWGLDKTVQALEDLPLSETQAARIVRTEVTRAVNTGIIAAGDTMLFEQTKEWIAVDDKRTRGRRPKDHASHVALDGVKIDFDDYFTDPRNGDKLFMPGDPKATAASTINCRCNMSVVLKTDARGRLIPKRKISVVMPGEFVRNNPMITI